MSNIHQFKFESVPDSVFRHKSKSATSQFDADKRFQKIIEKNPDGTDRIEYTDDGPLVYHVGFPYPEKGIRDNFVMISIQIVKRYLIAWINFLSSKPLLPAYFALLFLPWKYKIKLLENFLHSFESFANIIDSYAYHFTMEYRNYTPFGQELINGLRVFFKELGTSDSMSLDCSFYLASLLDTDRGYRYREQDVLSTTTSERIYKNPRKEILFLIKIWMEREGRGQVYEKMKGILRIASLVLWLPKVKRAIRKAVKAIKFERMQLDEADSYHVKFLGGYKFLGMTYRERLEKWPEILNQQFPLVDLHYELRDLNGKSVYN